MSKATLVARLLLGLIFFVFGLNGFLNFIPPPPGMTESAQAFFAGAMGTVYFFPLLKGTEVICGLLLLSGFYVPLALTVLAPILINILMFHLFVMPGPALAIVMIALELYLAYQYRSKFAGVLSKK